MSIPLCIMDWEVYDTGNQTSMQMNTEAFAIWLDAELKRRDMSALELERLSGVPDSTTSRIINLEVEEVKASVIAQIAKGLNEDFWKLMNIAGFAGKPGDLDGRVCSPCCYSSVSARLGRYDAGDGGL
jgi:DNA-binding Xre family transcriptional regulator